MAFPSSPIDNQVASVNNVTYIYNSAKGAWTKANTTTGLVNATITMSNLSLNSGVASTSQLTGALIVAGGAGINGALYIANTGDVSANIGAYQLYANANIVATQANLGSYQTYANANVVAIQANLGEYQTYANANAATQATSIDTTNANIGAFYNYANTKIGTNSDSNLVVVATTTSTSTTTGALVVAGGAGIAGNVTVGGNLILSDGATLSSATVYDLDDLSPADGFTNSFITRYNQNAVTFTNPWQLLVTIDGAVQPAFDASYDTVWFGSALTASRGYTIDTTGNIKFADCPPQGSFIMARTVVGSPNPTKKIYPFKPLDIVLGI